MIEYRPGNFLEAPAALLAHGVNCRGGFGKGVAAQIAQIWPYVKEAYLIKHRAVGWQPGDVQLVAVKPGVYVANCATQRDYWSYGNPRKDYVDYNGVAIAMRELILQANGSPVAMPKIGSGLAGGDWNQIEAIINRAFGAAPVWVYSGFVSHNEFVATCHNTGQT